jgi:hypothetical protein
MTFERISTFVPVKGTPNTAPSEDHLVLSQCPSFICQNIFNLPQVFTNCCAESYREKVDLVKKEKRALVKLLVNRNMHGCLLGCMGRCVIFQVIHILVPIYKLCIQTFNKVQRNLQHP